jgi:hypothetical protein
MSSESGWSFASVLRPALYFRPIPINGHRETGQAGPFYANYRRGLIRYFRSFRLGLILAAACRANVLLQSSKIV